MSQPFKKHFPWLVPTFVVINIVLFIVAMALNNCPGRSRNCFGAENLGRFAFESLKENPLLGPATATLERLGALEVNKVVQKHQAWRLFTLQIGLLYIISGLGGSLLSSLFIRTSISVGASGALFGLLGGMLSELITNWTIYANKLAALSTLLLIIILNLAVGILPHVDNFAHIGGFVTGFLLGFVFLMRPQYAWVRQKHSLPDHSGTPTKPKYKIYQYVLLVISLIILVVGFVVGLVLLLQGVDGNKHCCWCHYMKCIPTRFWKCDSDQPVTCESSIVGDELTLKCLSNGKSEIYNSGSNYSSSNLEHMCLMLCSS
ncbi:hypothetical protein NMG60_11034040 [Bertholletia excelsa]